MRRFITKKSQIHILMVDTTIVTFYLNIGRDEWEHFQRPDKHYIDSLQVLCNNKWKVIAFIDKTLEGQINLDNTKIVWVDNQWLTENTKAFQQLDDIQTIMDSNHYQLLIDHRKHHPEHNNATYNAIQNAKIDLIAYAVNQDWVDTEYVAWVDAGFFIHGKHPNLDSTFSVKELLNKHKTPIVYPSTCELETKDMDPLWTLIHAPFKVCGCLFGMETQNVNWFQDIYHQTVNDLMDLGIVDDDQAIVTNAISRNDNIGLEILPIPHDIIKLVTVTKFDMLQVVNNFMKESKWETKTNLCTILEENGSDKGGSWHNYSSLYDSLFHTFINTDISIFELGIGSNNLDVKSNMGKNGTPLASLRSWREYFGPKSIIRAADVDKRILSDEDQIKTFHCDQTNRKSVIDMWNQCDVKQFDIIIDDALHEFHANLNFLSCSYDKLKPGGLFIIEDCTPDTLSRFNLVFSKFAKMWGQPQGIKIVSIPHETNIYDNNIIIIQK
jgi:hypothetical protein